MKAAYLIFLGLLIFSCKQANTGDKPGDDKKPEGVVLVIHGGAGNMTPESIPAEMRMHYLLALNKALDKGHKMLKEGKSAVEVVAFVVSMLEDDSLFNAGKGAVLTEEGKAELDASIMDGKDGKAGAAAGLSQVKNPVLLAKLIMEKSAHVFLIGRGAEKFAFANGMDSVSNDYFITPRMRAKFEEKTPHGTVGAVALDMQGNIAAATSTGGMWGKKFGRVGDVPVIGAGTYANNQSCGVSCTGWGEYFIRNTASAQIHYRMLYGKESLDSAVQHTLDQIGVQGGDGGIIAIDKHGNHCIRFNSPGMFRAAIGLNGMKEVELFRKP